METFSLEQFATDYPVLFAAILIWSLVWKGLALWKAARLNDRGWFMALLIVNLLGLLEIIYLFFIAPKKQGGQVEPADSRDRPN